MANRKNSRGESPGNAGNPGNSTARHVVQNFNTGDGKGIFKTPNPFATPALSSIEILAKGKTSKHGGYHPSSSGGNAFSRSSAEARFMRVVNRAPEVMVKVTGGGMSTGQIRAHLEYMSRNGKLQVETSENEILADKDEIAGFIDAWEIDSRHGAGVNRQAHNIMLSMPKGTDPAQVRLAAMAFAKEQFGEKYPYAMVLHTDKAHPHVHLCVRMAPNERKDGKLFIRRETLEEYRQHFAEKMTERGIEAAATPREYRGVIKRGKKIAVYHAEKAGRSTVAKAKMQEAVKEVLSGQQAPEPWRERIKKRREAVLGHYSEAAKELELKGKFAEALRVREYMKTLSDLKTEKDSYRERAQNYIANKQRQIQQQPQRTKERNRNQDFER